MDKHSIVQQLGDVEATGPPSYREEETGIKGIVQQVSDSLSSVTADLNAGQISARCMTPQEADHTPPTSSRTMFSQCYRAKNKRMDCKFKNHQISRPGDINVSGEDGPKTPEIRQIHCCTSGML